MKLHVNTNISSNDRNAEIGWTWYSSKVWRTRLVPRKMAYFEKTKFCIMDTFGIQFFTVL
ncbi:hypothetical protein Back11_20040 [Paenibacillus baekrokdamisoli]|uniref:Uncharacterized protein n=1 Tax=Paenibacillus baekrokdamisoli TaxID=1712516 RepID=A0A3G9JCI0_9BACL|nr:hypothetical protein [Paenibacillus baekrokdamisoli]BBH20659.1 hypothetical protein Back11_20040 [Paenibacillus baekrokdamisoli]